MASTSDSPAIDTALLTEATVVTYVLGLGDKMIPLVLGLSPSPPHTVTEITDGNLNYAWAVRDAVGGGVFVKQAPPYIKCLGADYGLPAVRMLLESAAIDLYGRVAPGTVPRHLHLDPQRCVMVLELLDGYELMRTALRAGRGDSTLAEFNDFCMHASEVGTFMGRTHKATHRDRVPAAERAALEAQFANATMCGITADYVFTKPLDAADPTNKCSAAVAGLAATLRADEDLRRGVAEMREIFLTVKECLIHGDLHTGSVMVPAAGRSGTAKVIDGEFAFYGPAAFDVGTFVANIAFALVSVGVAADVAADDDDEHKRLLQMIRNAWHAYAGEMGNMLSGRNAYWSDDDVRLFIERAAGFAGCELIRRVIGAAHVDDLELMPAGEKRDEAEWAALKLGMMLVKTRSTGPPELEERIELFWRDIMFS